LNFAHLADRSLVNITGDEAQNFLDNILTCNLKGLKTNQASFGALLTPQGKILFDFFIVKKDYGYLVDIKNELAADFIKRLTFYRLRAKVGIEADESTDVYALWGNDLSANDDHIQDPRLKAMGFRHYGKSPQDADEADYNLHSIENGMPQGGTDYAYGDAYPHEVLMDQFGGVDFRKGCYVGQEVVSRMQHRGTTKKRIIQVEGKASLPSTGTPVTADGKPAGILGAVSNHKGLALLRLDRIAKAQEVLAGETEITSSLQPWVSFKMPETDE
jgi:folate-binding protein YgfZ